jgi:hypothetical protein
MLDLKVDLLTLSIVDAAGHEHRIQPIAARAAALFAERLEGSWGNNSAPRGAAALESVAASPLDLHLGGMSDQEAANEIANAWLEALGSKLR